MLSARERFQSLHAGTGPDCNKGVSPPCWLTEVELRQGPPRLATFALTEHRVVVLRAVAHTLPVGAIDNALVLNVWASEDICRANLIPLHEASAQLYRIGARLRVVPEDSSAAAA